MSRPLDFSIQILGRDLTAAVKAVLPAVETSSKLPVLQGCLLTVSDAGVTLVGTDTEETVTVTLPVTAVSGAGSLLLQAANFYKLVSALPQDDTITMESLDDSKLCRVRWAKGSKSEMKTLPADRYPTVGREIEAIQRFTVPAFGLAAAVSAVFHSLPTRPTRASIRGAHLVIQDDGRLTLVGTDHVRLFIARCAGVEVDSSIEPSKELEERHIIVSRAALQMLASQASDERMIVTVGRNEVEFMVGTWSLRSQRLEGTYPDFNSLLRRLDEGTAAIFNRAELMHAISAVGIIGSQVVNTPMDMIVDRGDSGGFATLLANGRIGNISTNEEAEVSIDCEWAGGRRSIALNGDFALDALEALAGRDRVKVLLPVNPGDGVLIAGLASDGDQGIIAQRI